MDSPLVCLGLAGLWLGLGSGESVRNMATHKLTHIHINTCDNLCSDTVHTQNKDAHGNIDGVTFFHV